MADDKPLAKQGLTVEIATARRDILLPVFGGIMRPQDDVLLSRGGGKGLKIYDEIERDAHAYAVLQKRKLAVIARNWTVEPADDSRAARKAAALVDTALKLMPFDRICKEQLTATLKGYAVGEVIWQPVGDLLLPVDVRPKDQRRFVFDEVGELRMLTWQSMWEGEALPPRKFLVHRFGSETGDPYGLGLGHKLFWPVWFKRQGISFWLIFAEKFGSPTVKGTAAGGMSEEERDELLADLAAVAQETALVVPPGVEVEYLEAARSGSINTYGELVAYMDQQISVTVLGETLTTTMGQVGSRAASETHNDVREELTDADADLLSATLNQQLVQWIIDLNMPGAPVPSVYRPRPARRGEEANVRKKEADAETAEVAAFTAKVSAGFIPADPNGDLPDLRQGKWTWSGAIKAPVAAPATPPDPAALAFADPATKPRDQVDDLVDQVDTVSAKVMDELIGTIAALVHDPAITTMDELAQRLVALYPNLPVQELAAVLAEAMTLAELQGRAELMNGG